MRLTSSLVLEMERFETEAVKFSKLTKVSPLPLPLPPYPPSPQVALYSSFKRSVVRDFRIISEKLQPAQAEQPDKEKGGKKRKGEEAEHVESPVLSKVKSEEEASAPPKKKAKGDKS